MAQEIKIANVLSDTRAFITYVPLRTEVPLSDYVSLPAEAVTYEITPRSTLDPAHEAKLAMQDARNLPTAILLPGSRFDATGTRHGRGGGWYDRFLLQVPKNWLRIGFCYASQFSHEVLERKPWDQPVDYVCVADGETLTVYQTNARDI